MVDENSNIDTPDGAQDTSNEPSPGEVDSLHELFQTHEASGSENQYPLQEQKTGSGGLGRNTGLEQSNGPDVPGTRRVVARWVTVTVAVGALTALGLGFGTIDLGGDLTTFAAGLIVGISGLFLGFAEVLRRR